MAAKQLPKPVTVRSRNSMVKIVASVDEGLAIVTFSLYDAITTYDAVERRIDGTDAYNAEELTALSKVLAAAARRLNRAA